MRARQSRDLPDRRNLCIGLSTLLSVGWSVLWPHRLLAQAAGQPENAARVGDASAQSPDDAANPVRVGDQWTYDTKDEITGMVTRTYTATVSEITPKEIVTHLTFRGNNNIGLVSFDHEWNRFKNGNLEYKPRDGQGVSFPLSVGKEWKFEYFTTNVTSGLTTKTLNQSRVAAQEAVTTPAGTFDTFRIERQVKEYNTKDPSRWTEAQVTLWYAPQINHWARRTIVTKVENRLRSKETDELVAVVRAQ